MWLHAVQFKAQIQITIQILFRMKMITYIWPSGWSIHKTLSELKAKLLEALRLLKNLAGLQCRLKVFYSRFYKRYIGYD